MDTKLNNNLPIYMQIMDKIRISIIARELAPGQKIPSVRELAEAHSIIESFIFQMKSIGLLGPNGSGKTTLMRIMAGLYNSYSGEVLIDGIKPGAASKARVAYLPDRPAFSLKKNVGDIC